jgi:vacuolar-type H+-ATPase subunit C/Vma6
MKQCNAADLLEKSRDSGYPSDYILSRIRGRKARFIPDWRPLVASPSPLEHLPEGHYQRIVKDRTPEGIWRALLIEYRWVYRQMNEQLRRIFGPFFVYAELRTVFICLRNLKEMKKAAVREMLSVSLLSDKIRKILTGSTDELAAARAMEEQFAYFSGRFTGIAEILHQKGLTGFEHELTERYLSVIVQSGINPVLQAFFKRLIDARNILSLAKLMKLGASAEHAFIPCGSIDIGMLGEMLASTDRRGIERLLKEFSGGETSSIDPVRLEPFLYHGISRSLIREGRDTLSIGPILEYLWRCSIEAMNLSVLAYGHELERDIVAAEMVR